MSRAFVRESAAPEPLPERVISLHPNFVTAAGLQQIENRILELEAARAAARASDDAAAVAHANQDLNYWLKRRASARVLEPPEAPQAVRFGVRVTLRLEDGGEQSFRLVGEDEADPAQGLLSWVSPLAEALMGQEIGGTVDFKGRPAEIEKLEC